jgi:hypothetical protein
VSVGDRFELSPIRSTKSDRVLLQGQARRHLGLRKKVGKKSGFILLIFELLVNMFA